MKRNQNKRVSHLDQFIRNEFGSKNALAKLLNVTPAAVGYWTNKNPRSMLRHLPEVCKSSGKPCFYVLNVVLLTECDISATGSDYFNESKGE
jgi:hypothetical protein